MDGGHFIGDFPGEQEKDPALIYHTVVPMGLNGIVFFFYHTVVPMGLNGIVFFFYHTVVPMGLNGIVFFFYHTVVPMGLVFSIRPWFLPYFRPYGTRLAKEILKYAKL